MSGPQSALYPYGGLGYNGATMLKRLKRLLYWAIFIAIVLHVAALVLLGDSYLPAPLP